MDGAIGPAYQMRCAGPFYPAGPASNRPGSRDKTPPAALQFRRPFSPFAPSPLRPFAPSAPATFQPRRPFSPGDPSAPATLSAPATFQSRRPFSPGDPSPPPMPKNKKPVNSWFTGSRPLPGLVLVENTITEPIS